MTGMRITFGVLAAIAVVAAGCQSASLGSNQTFHVSSFPDKAECEVTRNGQSLGKLTTPGSVEISRSRQPLSVVCTKEGYEEARSVVNSETHTGPFNGLAGPGPIGAVFATSTVVDMANGADTQYRAITVRLLPLSSADKGATAAAAPSKPGESSWSALALLDTGRSKSRGCLGAMGWYTFTLSGDVMTLDSPSGRLFTVTVSSDGAFRQAFPSPTGEQLEMTGNARTRTGEVADPAARCYWNVIITRSAKT